MVKLIIAAAQPNIALNPDVLQAMHWRIFDAGHLLRLDIPPAPMANSNHSLNRRNERCFSGS
ncbi:MAG: hypothetical protein NTW90_07635 [Nitrosospira sp.]|nr:hypothetical protein [Nitrosospira sp.]